MRELRNGQDKITVEKEKGSLKVFFRKVQYDADAMDIIKLYAHAEVTEENLVLTYELPQNGEALDDVIKKTAAKLDRLQLAEKICRLSEQAHQYRLPFLHPEVLYVDGEKIRVIHYGLAGILAPMTIDDELFLKEVKALIVSIFHPELAFEKILDGLLGVKDKFAEAIAQTKTMDELVAFIENELREEKKAVAATKRLVSKTAYSVYRIVGIVGLTLAIVSGVTTYFFWSSAKKQDAIIAAQASYITNNYAKAQSNLEDYAPESLPKTAQYILAVSGVQLSNLTDAQKEAVLNTLSAKSDTNTLLYWIYTGRGKFSEALNLGQNLGDDQLILLAYINLYQVTKLDSKMDGAEKQKLLKEYDEKIKELEASILGKETDESKK